MSPLLHAAMASATPQAARVRVGGFQRVAMAAGLVALCAASGLLAATTAVSWPPAASSRDAPPAPLSPAPSSAT